MMEEFTIITVMGLLEAVKILIQNINCGKLCLVGIKGYGL